MTCRCGYQFVLDPKTDRLTDGRLLAAARRAGSNNTHYFTANQLATAARQLHDGAKTGRLSRSVLTGCLALGAAFFVATLAGEGTIIIALFLSAVALICFAQFFFSDSFDKQEFSAALSKYQGSGRTIEYLLRDDGPLMQPPPDWSEEDIYDYGVEAILIVQHNRIVDQLVLNGFHAAARVLVVSESGYPQYIVPHVKRILEDQPDIRVCILHDATAKGASMLKRMKAFNNLPLGDRPITDLGLASSDLSRTPNLSRFEIAGQVALDHLTWSRLSDGLTLCMAGEATLGESIGKEPDESLLSFG